MRLGACLQNERVEEHLVGDRLIVFTVVMTSETLPMLKPIICFKYVQFIKLCIKKALYSKHQQGFGESKALFYCWQV